MCVYVFMQSGVWCIGAFAGSEQEGQTRIYVCNAQRRLAFMSSCGTQVKRACLA